MIAAGLCLMGGCFAQDENGFSPVSYWPAVRVCIPSYTAGSSLSIYEHSAVPAGIRFEDCRVFTFQVLREGLGSFFFVIQNDLPVYNCFAAPEGSGCRLFLAKQEDESHVKYIKYPVTVELYADSTGASIISQKMNILPAAWNSALPATRLRILDARAGEKDFYVAHGQWGWMWYLLPMRSVTKSEAVFDFEEKALVEL